MCCCGMFKNLILAILIVGLYLLTGLLARFLVPKDSADWIRDEENQPKWTPSSALGILLTTIYLISSAASAAVLFLLAKHKNIVYKLEKFVLTIVAFLEIGLVIAAVARGLGFGDVKAASAILPLAAVLSAVRVIVSFHSCILSALIGLPGLALIITGAVWVVGCWKLLGE